MNVKLPLILAAVGLSTAACVTPPTPYNYASFRAEAPHSILVLPALNNTANVEAADWFLSTVSQPFAERGYYVFPANMVRGTLNENGLSDAGLVHAADARRLQGLFGCDAALFININRWDSQYLVINTTTTVQFDYELRSCSSNAVLWKHAQAMAYSPQASRTGNIIGDIVATAIVAAIEKGHPNYMPLARQANLMASTLPGQGVPAGPYRPDTFGKDQATFPAATGN